MGSSRLPGKVLEKIGDYTVLDTLITRLLRCKTIDLVVIASTTEIRDRPVLEVARSRGVEAFAGSEHDVLDRYYRASEHFELDTIIRVTADCPLVDSEVVDEMVQLFLNSDVDFLSNSEPLPTSWPDGMDVSIFSRGALKLAWENATLPSEREHVTFFFPNKIPERCKKHRLSQDLSHIRLTVDYPEDLVVLNEIQSLANGLLGRDLVDLTMAEIIQLISSNLDIASLNSMYSRGIGWEESFARDNDKERSGWGEQ
jgi:spore coat polysaccharide biosynthesis protein SpsF (cytidylyltransferase family)